VCVTELKFSLLGQSCMVCPGAIALVSNLLLSVDAEATLRVHAQQLPPWVQEYLEGSAQELYDLSPVLTTCRVSQCVWWLLTFSNATELF